MKKILGYVLLILLLVGFIVFGTIVGGWHFVIMLSFAFVFVIMLSVGAYLIGD